MCRACRMRRSRRSWIATSARCVRGCFTRGNNCRPTSPITSNNPTHRHVLVMNVDPDNQDELQKMLALKRHELRPRGSSAGSPKSDRWPELPPAFQPANLLAAARAGHRQPTGFGLCQWRGRLRPPGPRRDPRRLPGAGPAGPAARRTTLGPHPGSHNTARGRGPGNGNHWVHRRCRGIPTLRQFESTGDHAGRFHPSSSSRIVPSPLQKRIKPRSNDSERGGAVRSENSRSHPRRSTRGCFQTRARSHLW